MTPGGWRRARRRLVKQQGKRALRGLSGFLASRSRVGDPPVFDPAVFAWTAGLTQEWTRIRDEARAILARREELPGFARISPDQYRIAPDDGWKTFFFRAFGHRDGDALAACPATARLLARVPGLETAFYSVLPPGAHVPEHRGITKGIVRAHLPLIVPGAPGDCRIRIGSELHAWQPGELLLFDDTVRHEVWNDADADRVVLLFDFRRPMDWPGALVSSLFIRALKRSAYVRDGLSNYAEWKRGWEAGAPPDPARKRSSTATCRSSSDSGISG